MTSIACTEVGRQDGPNGARKAPLSGHVDGFIRQHRRRVRAFPHQTYVFLQGEVSYFFSPWECFESNDADIETSLRWILEISAFHLYFWFCQLPPNKKKMSESSEIFYSSVETRLNKFYQRFSTHITMTAMLYINRYILCYVVVCSLMLIILKVSSTSCV